MTRPTRKKKVPVQSVAKRMKTPKPKRKQIHKALEKKSAERRARKIRQDREVMKRTDGIITKYTQLLEDYQRDHKTCYKDMIHSKSMETDSHVCDFFTSHSYATQRVSVTGNVRRIPGGLRE